MVAPLADLPAHSQEVNPSPDLQGWDYGVEGGQPDFAADRCVCRKRRPGLSRSLKVAEGRQHRHLHCARIALLSSADPGARLGCSLLGAGPAAFRQVVTRQRRLRSDFQPSVIQALICDRAARRWSIIPRPSQLLAQWSDG